MTRQLSEAASKRARDTIICAAEGGSNYWAHGFRYTKTHAVSLSGENAVSLDEFVSAISGIEFIEDESGDRFALTLAQIETATNKIVRDHSLTSATIRTYIVSDDIDADAADCIIQIAAFGKLVYG